VTTLLATQHYAPDDTSTAAYLTAIAEEMAKDDDVIVLSGTRGSAAAGGPGKPHVIELPSWTPPKGALLRRAIAMLWFATAVFTSVLRRSTRATLVVVVTTPFVVPFAAILASRIRRARSVLIVYDVYPEVLIAARLAVESSYSVRLISRLNAWMFGALTAIVIISRDMQRHFTRYPASTAGKLVYIPNWATLPARARPVDPANRFRGPFGPRFVVGLSGNLGFTHDPETVFAAARELAGEAGIGFLLSGWGVGWERLKRLQEDARLPNVHLIDRVASEDIEEFLASADCWLIPNRKGMVGISVPSRLYNFLAIGRPVIMLSEADAEHAHILSEHDAGWVVPPQDPVALVEAIRRAAADPAATALKGHRAVGIIGERFTREAVGRAYRALARRLRASLDPPGPADGPDGQR
jgi:colanic acid biosynthesis glycosyl transferase WcaI